MSDVYEAVGHIDRAVQGSVSFDSETIIVDNGGDDLIVARPRNGDDDE